jgi:predicted RNase H-like nuclease
MDIKIDISSKKLKLIQWLSTIENVSIIEKIMDLKKKENSDWWSSISESEQQSIELGLKDSEDGKLNSHSKARDLYEKWL